MNRPCFEKLPFYKVSVRGSRVNYCSCTLAMACNKKKTLNSVVSLSSLVMIVQKLAPYALLDVHHIHWCVICIYTSV